MMSELRGLQITEFLEVVRGIIDSSEFGIAGFGEREAEAFRIRRCIVRLQVAQTNLQFALDGLQDVYASLPMEE